MATPFFRYEPRVSPAAEQLERAGVPAIRRIILSHSHWDHASGVGDFPDAQVWVAPEELARVHEPTKGAGGTWPSQVGDPSLRFRTLQLGAVPYEGFERSLDVYGDGSVIVVAMFGHTPGSIGMFVKTSSGKRFFFVGDVVWSTAALREARPKFWPARMLVDEDSAKTQRTIEQIRGVQRRDPSILIVPAHDGLAQDALGYFPAWAE